MSAAVTETSSCWLEDDRPEYAAVTQPGEYDVVVIGGGITGLTAALLLKKAGRRVAVVERGRIGDCETGHTTAHLTQVLDTRLTELASRFGKEQARLAWEAGSAAINTIEAVIHSGQIDCRFQRVPGFLCSPITQDASTDDVESLEQEAALARELGFDALFVSAVPLFNRPAMRVANQGVFHPVKYLAALARLVHCDGCAIFENSEAEIDPDDFQAVDVNGIRLRGARVISATHVPLAGRQGAIAATLTQSKLAAYSTYAISGEVPRGMVPEACIWDTQDPYYYFRVQPGEAADTVIFGGADHRTGQETATEACFQKLEAVLKSYVPGVQIQHRWSGQVQETPDGLPYIGDVAEGQFIATGYAGNGMTFGTLAGMMICDAIVGRDNPWQDLFSPDRRALRGGLWNYLKENFSYPHYLIRGFLEKTDGDSIAVVPPGEGRIVRMDGHRCAVYRNQNGEVTVLDAVCTHMGCLVRWNNAAETWDCPCHGSRFTTDGEIIAGPAESPLEKRIIH